jgi:opacity protein-like surface antigen
MMKRMLAGLVASGFLMAVAAAPAAAQARGYIGFGAGAAIPTGDFANGAKLGWLGQVIAGITGPSGRLGGRIDGDYSRHSYKGATSGHTGLFGANADVVVNFRTTASKARPYILAGVGFYNVKFTGTSGSYATGTSLTKGAFNGGAGVNIKTSHNMAVYLEGRFVSIRLPDQSFNFIPLSIGLRWGGW